MESGEFVFMNVRRRTAQLSDAKAEIPRFVNPLLISHPGLKTRASDLLYFEPRFRSAKVCIAASSLLVKAGSEN
jgi:hypothetical protein